MLSFLFRNLRFTRTSGRYRFFENGKIKERSRYELFSQTDCLKVNVQELTESMKLPAIQVRVGDSK